MNTRDHSRSAAADSTESLRPTDSYSRSEVSCTQAKIYRAIALVRLCSDRLLVYAGNTDGSQTLDHRDAMLLRDTLEIAYEYLDESAEDCEEFTEIDSEPSDVPSLLRRQAGGVS